MNKLIRWLLGIAASVWEVLEPVLKGRAATAIEELLPVALDLVKRTDERDLPGPKKFEIAHAEFKQIVREHFEHLIQEATTSLLNFLIELAVRSLKAKKK